MGDKQSKADEVKAAFDKVVQATNNPEAMQRAITEAKKKVDELMQSGNDDKNKR